MSARALVACLVCVTAIASRPANARPTSALDAELKAALSDAGFTGRVAASLEDRLGRDLDLELADVGRLLWFDTVVGLHDDNSCAGCHSPTNGWGDTQSIAIGIQSNGVVGASRTGPRNQRRAPSIINAAFYRALMWNGRFWSESDDPFDNSAGFTFGAETPLPFDAGDPVVNHLLIAQAYIPPVHLEEMAGFTGTAGFLDQELDAFDDGLGDTIPFADREGLQPGGIRDAIVDRLNAIPAYVDLFGDIYPSVAQGDPIDVTMFARALAEFELTQVYANAPIDRFARGDETAMTSAQKKGALVFFGDGKCVSCHAVSGDANEMFSDFNNHNIGVPQIAPRFGVGKGNVVFDGPGEDEDYGLEQVTENPDVRYWFRTTPLRNVALAPAYFHNGSFTDLEDAIRHHLDAYESARNYDPVAAGVDEDLTHRLGPVEPVLADLDRRIADPPELTETEIANLVTFVRDGLLDERALPAELCALVPDEVPSGADLLKFPGCRRF
jgi:cytochrome c peroxidase